jgi:hypothetical protein
MGGGCIGAPGALPPDRVVSAELGRSNGEPKMPTARSTTSLLGPETMAEGPRGGAVEVEAASILARSNMHTARRSVRTVNSTHRRVLWNQIL